jgi:sugar-phosphatase
VWGEAAVFAALGVQLTEAELVASTGQAITELIPIWRQRQPLGGTAGMTDEQIADQIVDIVVRQVTADGEPMPGVASAIAMFRRHGLGLAIASSSPRRLIDAVCARLGLDHISVRCSALDEGRGKPAPDVYLTAARRLGECPASCLAIEDSPHGVQAAKAAGMRCLAVPDPLLAGDPRYRDADLILPSLERLNARASRQLGLPPELEP